MTIVEEESKEALLAGEHSIYIFLNGSCTLSRRDGGLEETKIHGLKELDIILL